jgi:ABC-type phosphate transport system ATPase subunit|tara:strand:- start:335 stop:550 length:216 start_codon:yes stop_codon:yes gene_type:complete
MQDNSQLAVSNCLLAAKLEKMIDDAVEASKRHDIIVMRLANQIEAQRLQLEESQQQKTLIARLKALFMTGS